MKDRTKGEREREISLVPAGIPFFFPLRFKIRAAPLLCAASTPVSLIIIYLCATSGVCSPAQVNEPQPEASPANRAPPPSPPLLLFLGFGGGGAEAPPPRLPSHPSSVSMVQFIVDVTLLCFGPLVAVVLHDSMFLSPSDVSQRRNICTPAAPLHPPTSPADT